MEKRPLGRIEIELPSWGSSLTLWDLHGEIYKSWRDLAGDHAMHPPMAHGSERFRF